MKLALAAIAIAALLSSSASACKCWYHLGGIEAHATEYCCGGAKHMNGDDCPRDHVRKKLPQFRDCCAHFLSSTDCPCAKGCDPYEWHDCNGEPCLVQPPPKPAGKKKRGGVPPALSM